MCNIETGESKIFKQTRAAIVQHDEWTHDKIFSLFFMKRFLL